MSASPKDGSTFGTHFKSHSPASSITSDGKKRVKGRSSKSSKVPVLSWTEQVSQLLAIAAVAGVVASLGFLIIGWVQQLRKPFCDIGVNMTDDCIPCPQNGVCSGGSLECFPGFRRVSKSCVQDKEIDQTAQALAGHITTHVCGNAARLICEGAPGAMWLAETEIARDLESYDQVKQLKVDATKLWLTQEKAFRLASDILVTQENFQGQKEFNCPGELVQKFKPVLCQVKEWISQNLLIVLFGSPLVFLITVISYRCLLLNRINTQAQHLYLRVCEALEEKAMGDVSENSGRGSWVVVSHLRDHLLLPNNKCRGEIWKKVSSHSGQDIASNCNCKSYGSL